MMKLVQKPLIFLTKRYPELYFKERSQTPKRIIYVHILYFLNINTFNDNQIHQPHSSFKQNQFSEPHFGYPHRSETAFHSKSVSRFKMHEFN